MESSSTTGSNRLADRAWLRAMDAYAAGAYARAEEEFRAAVQLDPGMADAWLGLHALRCDTSGALLAMYRHQERFGEQRARHRRPLSSWYWLGWWVQPVLEDSRDLTLAHASHWLDGRHLTELDRALAECPPVELDPSVRFLHACRSYLLKDWEQLIRDTDRLLDDPLLGIEAGLFGGMARVRLDMCAQAQRPLAASLARCRSEQPQRKELRYWLARAYEGAGRSAAALPLYRAVHRADPAFMDAAARLAAISTEDGVLDGFLPPDEPVDDDSTAELLLPGTDFEPDFEPGYAEDDAYDGYDGQADDQGYETGGYGGDTRTGYQPDAPAEERAEPLDAPLPRPAAERAGAAAGATATGLPTGAAEREPAPLVAVPAGLDRARGREGLDAALDALEQMVGLDPVKRQVRALSAQLRMSRLRAGQGCRCSRRSGTSSSPARPAPARPPSPASSARSSTPSGCSPATTWWKPNERTWSASSSARRRSRRTT